MVQAEHGGCSSNHTGPLNGCVAFSREACRCIRDTPNCMPGKYFETTL
jgi:hypothetical protein